MFRKLRAALYPYMRPRAHAWFTGVKAAESQEFFVHDVNEHCIEDFIQGVNDYKDYAHAVD